MKINVTSELISNQAKTMKDFVGWRMNVMAVRHMRGMRPVKTYMSKVLGKSEIKIYK